MRQDVAYFRYKRNFARRWCPEVLFSDEPIVVGKKDEGLVTQAVFVPDECLSEDGTPSIEKLVEWFPKPVEAEDA